MENDILKRIKCCVDNLNNEHNFYDYNEFDRDVLKILKEPLNEFIYWLNETSLDGQERCAIKTKAQKIFGEDLIE